MGPQEVGALLAAMGPPTGSCPGSRGTAGTPGQMTSRALWAPWLSRGSFTASVVIHGPDCSEKLVCRRGCWSLVVQALGNLPRPLGSDEG